MFISSRISSNQTIINTNNMTNPNSNTSAHVLLPVATATEFALATHAGELFIPACKAG